LPGEGNSESKIATPTAAAEVEAPDADPSQSCPPKKQKKPKSKRLQYMGKTPGKGSKTGQAVIERMQKETPPRIRLVDGGQQFKASNGKWHPIEEADMCHKPTDAVKYWNEAGRKFGPRSPEVRKFMLDSKNYELDHFSLNRSQGARIGIGYLHPL
jgi:hypothetical protein